MLATVAGVAVREGLIKDLDAPVGASIKDGGYDSPQNAKVTWRHHLQQESEWEGEMWGKKHDFVGTVAFGDGERKPRAVQAPGTFYEYNDVRINRFSLSMLRLFKKPVPEVFRDEVMNVIGASNELAVDSLQEQLRRRRRQEARVGQRRDALGRRRLDQRAGHGALRLSLAARRPLGHEADPAARVREDGVDAERARPRLRLPLVAEHARAERRRCRPTRSRRRAPAAIPFLSRPITTS